MPLVYSAELLLQLLAEDFRSYTAWKAEGSQVEALSGHGYRLSSPSSSFLSTHLCCPVVRTRRGAARLYELYSAASAARSGEPPSCSPRAPSKHYFRADASVSGPGDGLQA